MARVVLIRPGSTDYDEQGRIQGVLNVPLSARGTDEVARAAEELRAIPMATIYCGAEESGRATARAIADALGVRVRRLGKLHNLNHGLWQGLQEEEIRHKHPRVYRQWCEAPMTVCPPEGETIMDAYQRVCRVLRPVIKRHRQEVIGIVVPEPIASVVRCYLLRQDPARVWEMREANGRWQVLEVDLEEAAKNAKR